MSRMPTWWTCPLCAFKIRDDGSSAAAHTMTVHIEGHELVQNWTERSQPSGCFVAFRRGLAMDAHGLAARIGTKE
jgi:tRNA U34 5-methylaminomethyl-2-thiouridine-forming methyltransferase MnmC